MANRSFTAAFIGVLLAVPIATATTQAQEPSTSPGQWPVQTVRPTGQTVTPVFEGWFRNPDGTISLSFGYYSRNSEEIVDIPVGPDNFIEPAMYNGKQPTHFLPQPRDRGPGRGLRYWSVFTIAVPADFQDQVVWTLRHRGETFAIPGHIRNSNYEMDALRVDASGSTPPVLRFSPDGPSGIGPSGIETGPLATVVGTPFVLEVWATDDTDPPVTLKWFKHQGPGEVIFSQDEMRVENPNGRSTTTATFDAPGDYMLRVRATDQDTEFDRYCCWTNGYLRVSVAPR